jgi:hypothetical protein
MIDAINDPSATDVAGRPVPAVANQPDTVSGDPTPETPEVD